MPPSLTLKWGPYTKPDPAEQLATVQTIQAALGGTSGTPLVTLDLAVEKLRQGGVFDIDDVGTIVEELTRQAEEKAEEAKAEAEALANAKAGPGASQRGNAPPQNGKPE